jgi:hypothetical protein
MAEKIQIKEIIEEILETKKGKSYVMLKILDINDKEVKGFKNDNNKDLRVGDEAIIRKVKTGKFWKSDIYPVNEENLKMLEKKETSLSLDIEEIKQDIKEILSILKK